MPSVLSRWLDAVCVLDIEAFSLGGKPDTWPRRFLLVVRHEAKLRKQFFQFRESKILRQLPYSADELVLLGHSVTIIQLQRYNIF